jgi:RNA polymerase sigma factor (TIGR02999 family)
VTRLLLDWRSGREAALSELMPIVYEKLRWLAKRYMRRQAPGQTLQTTALIHEAYLKLVDYRDVRWSDRCVLVDHARSQTTSKRGNAPQMASLDEALVISPEKTAEVLALDDALDQLAVIDPRKGRIVELRYFGGLSVEETAEVLAVSPATVKREWVRAKAWLHRQIAPGNPR